MMLSGSGFPPKRRILSLQDLARFQSHQSYTDILSFIQKLNIGARDKLLPNASSAQTAHSPIISDLLQLLECIQQWTLEYPPVDNDKSRFGNPSFRQWFDRLTQSAPSLLKTLRIPSSHIPEVAAYLCASFGDRKRIDYGTGHELSFIAFLLCLEKLNLISDPSSDGGNDFTNLVLVVFWKYVLLMRKLQTTYWLEPAGSHGVWGLDDYQFLPFLFGSSQMFTHRHLRPKSVRDSEVVSAFEADYMYFNCIGFINSVKSSVGLGWHSPMLNDISGVKTWAKVNEGMTKMYCAEVLGKLPIMQHFLFGSLIVFDEGSDFPDEGVDQLGDGHEHVFAFGQQFPTCCGMRIPSALAAAAGSSKGGGIVPFD